MSIQPKLVLVMRHAEKPLQEDDPHLTPAGQARANALAQYIPQTFGDPDFIFAAAVSKRSARPYETVAPLQGLTKIPIDTRFADDDYSALARELLSNHRYASQTIVVCWHHANIPPLMRELQSPPGSFPPHWDAQVFNVILAIDYSSGDPHVTQITEPF